MLEHRAPGGQAAQSLSGGGAIHESLVFTQETVNGHRTCLGRRATAVGGTQLKGVTILTKDGSGQIVRAAIHHRPLGAVHGSPRNRANGCTA